MSKPGDPARVVFRVKSGEGDTEMVEEREVECAPEDLAALLAQPWDSVPHTDPPGKKRPEDIAAALEDVIRRLRFVVKEASDGEGGRRFELAFSEAGLDGEVVDAAIVDDPTTEGDRPVELSGRLCVGMWGDDEDPSVEVGTGSRQLIQVQNNALQVNHWGNTYVNMTLDLRCVIHCGDAQPEA